MNYKKNCKENLRKLVTLHFILASMVIQKKSTLVKVIYLAKRDGPSL